MKLGLELPSGLRITFEGDDASFDRFTAFLGDVPGLIESFGVHELPGGEGENAAQLPPGGDALSPRLVDERIRAVGATTDIERVTVLAQLAVEGGRDGIDYDTAARIYTDLGLPKPPRWSRTFANAKTRNLVRSAARGLWRPTIQGENFARLGHRSEAAPRRRSVAGGATSLSLETGGGEED
jgi:hypothetical protein